MCTVSFLPKPRGFYLAMNRDEKRERFAALAPAIVDLEGQRAVFPTEPNGGTWISANDSRCLPGVDQLAPNRTQAEE